MSKLFSPVRMGSYLLKNRVVFAPLTRSRAGDERLPNDLMATYYTQRSNAGFILTEATAVDPMGVGYAKTPGIWSDAQVDGWKKITKAVHGEGSVIFMQLWHVGRISHPMFLKGETPVAPSAIRPKGRVSLVRPETSYVTPRALKIEEIKEIVGHYKRGAENAKRAGFDGVEIHGANGYLVDQFLQDSTNHRTDIYGGSIVNRARFLLEVVDACIEVFGADKVGVHLSPRGDSHDMGDSNKIALFTYVARQLDQRKIAFIFTREYRALDSITHLMRQCFNGLFIVNEKYNRETAMEAVEKNYADMVAFGKDYISNPDLVDRLQKNSQLTETNWATVYADGATGYTDYSKS